jgi:hypothetical protein
MKMHPYILYQITRLDVADMNRRAEIHRIVSDARQDRRADRQLSARPRRRPRAVLQRLLPAVLTGSRR